MKLKVLMIETSGFGGLAYYTYCLCKKLSESSDINLTLLTRTDYELDNYKANCRVIKKDLISTSYLSAVLALYDVVNKERPDIIHVQSLISARKDWLLFLLARLFRISIIYTAHNVLPHDQEERTAFGMRFAFRMICKRSKAIITHSESNREALCSLYRSKEKKVSIIEHGNYLLQTKDVKRFQKDEAKKRLGLNPDDEVVLFFGAMREYKGIMDLLAAMKRLTEKRPKLRLLIAGKAKEDILKKTHSFIADNHLQEIVLFENRYIELEAFGLYFDGSDVVALPYKHSYGSGAIQTAMAFSKPIIITDIPYFREIVVEGKNGLFFKYADTESLSEMIGRFFSFSKDKQSMMAQASLAIAEENYGWGPIADKTISLYRQIVS